ncbi:alanine racemase [Halobacillus naozhouensis]|uniref:Alanine racemase n=1 Tax=Halobacillus naozhouensis TaxID=554880 RepID=A0ABY8J2Y9_9BACI|nr:alanine racemase [Halobacillus naozhouensis]WFT75261.1 alanine racemase [Halobacillus naozhouensis]
MSFESFYRDTWVEINLSAITHNIEQMDKRLPPRTGIYAVVKANAYGHGDIQVAKQAIEAGAERLAVSLLDEAIKLRRAGITAPILVMGWIRPEDAPVAADQDIAVPVFQKEWLEQLEQSAFNKPLKLHMKWDTGMGRIGIRSTEELDGILSAIEANPWVELEALFTHFATADEKDLKYYEEQAARFDTLYDHFKKVWSQPVEIHTGNSAASMRFPEDMQHYVRFGISMYGLYPSSVVKDERPIDLKPAFSLNSRLIHVKEVPPRESISYGATYQSESEEWIGTVPMGYADGWIRKLQGFEVLVDGKRHPIVGRICMDQFMIKLDREYSIGTKVTLIGKQDNVEVHTDELADYLDTINYEIPCMISYRVPRMYLKNGHMVEVDNTLIKV